jgi:hypothetical protein
MAAEFKPERRTTPIPPRPRGVEIAAIVSSSLVFVGPANGDRVEAVDRFRLGAGPDRGGVAGNGLSAEAVNREAKAFPLDKSQRAGKVRSPRFRCAAHARFAERCG